MQVMAGSSAQSNIFQALALLTAVNIFLSGCGQLNKLIGPSGDYCAPKSSARCAVPPPPSAPREVSATAGDGQVTVSWTMVTGESYNVYYGTEAGLAPSWSQSTNHGTKLIGASSPRSITGLTNGTKYFFIVTAVDNFGPEGDASLEASAVPAY